MSSALLVWFASFVAAANPAIAWHASLEQALSDAAAANRPVFIAVNMDGERANDEMVAQVYPDPRIVELSGATVNLFASTAAHTPGGGACKRLGAGADLSCDDHQAVEKAVRARFLKQDAQGNVVAPEHVFVAPDGGVLLSVPYRVTRGELEWCFVEAIRRLDPEFAWKLAADARPPRRLVVGAVSAPESVEAGAEPPTKAEIDDILDRLHRGERPWEMMDEVRRLLLADDPRVKTEVTGLLSSRFASRRGFRGPVLHSIGRLSPASYWDVVAPWLEDPEIDTRREAAVALEQLAAPAALNALLKRIGREKEEVVKADLLRAAAACGSDQRKVSGVLQETLKKSRSDALRAAATVASAALADRDLPGELAAAALADPAPAMRAAGGYVAALRRERDLLDALERAALLEEDPAAKALLDRCAAVLNGAPAADLDALLQPFVGGGTHVPRDRK